MSKPLLKLSMEELLKELRLNPALRKNSSARLAQMYSLSLTEVETARAILKSPSVEDVFDKEMLDKRLDEIDWKSKYEKLAQHLKLHPLDALDVDNLSTRFLLPVAGVEAFVGEIKRKGYLETICEERGIDLAQVTPTSMWIKDPKSKVNTYYSIHAKTKQENVLDLEEIKKIFAEEIPVFTPVHEEEPGKTLMLYFSDLHLGMMVEDDSLSEQKWNPYEFEQRMIATLSLVQNVDEVVVCCLGDILDGWNGFTTRGGHKLSQNLNNKQQYHTYIKTMQAYFTYLVSMLGADRIKFVSVSEGNHEGDMCHIANSALASWLDAKYPQIQTKVFDKYIDHFTVQDHTIIMLHGKDKENQRNGFPLYPDLKTENYFTRYMLQNNITPSKANVSVVKGDLHQTNNCYTETMRYRNVMALCPPSKWCSVNFLSTTSGLSYDIIEGDRIYSSELFF